MVSLHLLLVLFVIFLTQNNSFGMNNKNIKETENSISEEISEECDGYSCFIYKNKQYTCSMCKFSTKFPGNFKKHLSRKKHNIRECKGIEIMQRINPGYNPHKKLQKTNSHNFLKSKNNDHNENETSSDAIESREYDKTDIQQKNKGHEKLYEICQYDKPNIQQIKNLINHKADLNYTYKEETPLHLLCDHKSLSNETIKLLLEHKANPNTLDEYQDTPLHRTCDNPKICNKPEIIKLFLEYESNCNLQDKDGDTPLHRFYINAFGNPYKSEAKEIEEKKKNGIKKIFKSLLKHTNPNIQNNQKDTVLHWSCMAKELNTELILLLLKYNANVSLRNNNNKTPADLLASFHNKKLVTTSKEMIELFEEEEEEDRIGHDLVHNNDDETGNNKSQIKSNKITSKEHNQTNNRDNNFFLNFFSLEEKTDQKNSISFEVFEEMERNILNQTKPSQKSSDESPIIIIETEKSNNISEIQGFSPEKEIKNIHQNSNLKKIRNKSISDKNKDTVLHDFFDNKKITLEKIQEISNDTCNWNAQDKNGDTPSHRFYMNAFENPYHPEEECSKVPHALEIFKFILEKKADTNIKNKNGNTILHWACMANEPNLNLIKLLIENKAQPYLKNDNDEMPFNYLDEEDIKKLI